MLMLDGWRLYHIRTHDHVHRPLPRTSLFPLLTVLITANAVTWMFKLVEMTTEVVLSWKTQKRCQLTSRSQSTLDTLFEANSAASE